MTVTAKTKKPTYKTEKVLKDDGTLIYIKRCSLDNMELLMETQERLIGHLLESDGEVGMLFTKPEVIVDLKAICSILPVVSNKEEYLDYEDIQENWEQLIKLFFTDGLDEDSRIMKEVSPSRVSNLHFLPYMKTLRTLAQERELQKEKN